jgi:hypothetical protein
LIFLEPTLVLLFSYGRPRHFLLDETVVVFSADAAHGKGDASAPAPTFHGVVDKFRAVVAVELVDREDGGEAYLFEFFSDLRGDAEAFLCGYIPHLLPHKGGEDLPALTPTKRPDQTEAGGDLV